MAAEAAAEVVARCRELARISDEAGRTTRWFGSPAMARANALVGRWIEEAGMAARVDAAGNLVGHLPGSDPDAGTLLLGSHLDTVRDAGAFDGPLGVLAAVACVARLRAEEVTLPFAVDVLGFSDEEGLRFGTAYLGSAAVAGTLDAARCSPSTDADGVTVRDALAGFGPGRRVAPRASGCSATARCTSSRGRCWRRATRPSRWSRRSPARRARRSRSPAGRGTPGTVPMAGRRDAACGARRLRARRRGGRAGDATGSWRPSGSSRRGRARRT